MSAYGYEIVQTLIVDIEPDEHVKRAMNEINAGKIRSQLCWLVKPLRVSHCLDWTNSYDLRVLLNLEL